MSKCILGIDVSKKELSVALLKDDRLIEKKVSNSKTGFKTLASFLIKNQADNAKCFLEATGSYSENIANFLYDQNFDTYVVNPYKIKAFCTSRLSRTKTDRKDARMIAEYGIFSNDMPYQKPSENARKLRALYRTYASHSDMVSNVKNHLEHALDSTERECWKRTLDGLEEYRANVLEKILEIVRSDEELCKSFENLQTINGIGEITAIAILAEIYEINRFHDARQLAAYCGLTPRFFESGTSVHRKARISKMGNGQLRNALYLPAITAMSHGECFRNFAQKLKAKGKAKKVIIVAIMRKLLAAAFGVLKNKTKFNPDLLFKTA